MLGNHDYWHGLAESRAGFRPRASTDSTNRGRRWLGTRVEPVPAGRGRRPLGRSAGRAPGPGGRDPGRRLSGGQPQPGLRGKAPRLARRPDPEWAHPRRTGVRPGVREPDRPEPVRAEIPPRARRGPGHHGLHLPGARYELPPAAVQQPPGTHPRHAHGGVERPARPRPFPATAPTCPPSAPRLTPCRASYNYLPP